MTTIQRDITQLKSVLKHMPYDNTEEAMMITVQLRNLISLLLNTYKEEE